MPSTYTLNNGIELIATGEQSATWGDTTNTNLGLIDTALDGQVTITLPAAGSSGSPNALAISDGSASNGRNRLIIFTDGGDLGGTAFVQLTPNDAEKIVYIRNSLTGGRAITLFQGTYNASNDYEVPAGTTAVVFFNGGGSGAVAANVFNNAYFDSLRLGAVSVTAILDEDNMASNSATALATQQSIKAYVDTQVAANNELSEVLANGNTSGANNIQMTAAAEVQFRDTALKISSSVDGQLDIDADVELELTAPTLDINASTAVTIDTTTLTMTGSVNVVGDLDVDNLNLNGNAIISTNTDGNIDLTPNGTGEVNITKVDIDSGAIDGTVIGGTSAAAGTFTTATATTGNITTVNATTVDTTNIEVTTLKAKDGTSAGSIADSTGVVTLASSVLTTTDINGGTIDGAVIGGSSAAAGTFTTVTASGDVTIADKIVHSGDTNTAIRFPAADTVTVETSGTERMRITSAGNVGIGTSSPASIVGGTDTSPVLSIGGRDSDLVTGDKAGSVSFITNDPTYTGTYADGVTSEIASVSEAAGGSAYGLALYTGQVTGTSRAERMRIDSSGNVGVGTASPAQRLDVRTAAANAVQARFGFVSGRGLEISTASVAGTNDAGSVLNALGATAGTMIFQTDSTERMRITSSGNVGIGTTSPDRPLKVEGSVDGRFTAAAFYNNINAANTATSIELLDRNVVTGGTSAVRLSSNREAALNSFAFSVETASAGTYTERMRIDSSGNVGIGTSSPTVPLHVVNASTPRIYLGSDASKYGGLVYTAGTTFGSVAIRGQGNDTGTVVHVDRDNSQVRFDTAGSERMRITSTGNVGIGVTPSAWGSSVKVAQVSNASIAGQSNQALFSNNAFFDGAGWKYISSAVASQYYLDSNAQHQWLTAASGTAGNAITFTQAMTLDASGNLYPNTAAQTLGTSAKRWGTVFATSLSDGADQLVGSSGTTVRFGYGSGWTALAFATGATERARILSTGEFLVGKTGSTTADVGCELRGDGIGTFTVTSNTCIVVNRRTTDGTLVDLRQDNTSEGTISVSGTTVSYNGGHLSRWAQFPDNSRPELLKGTVMSNLDQMSQWGEEDNEQLNCVQVSTVEGDPDVAGVFVAWDSTDDGYNDILLAMTGDMVIRIGAGVTVARGDLLMSAGDGTAKPQGDDIVRSKTIAKVTSTHVSHTYADGSYAVPCVLMAC